jgi:hypothetical protein
MDAGTEILLRGGDFFLLGLYLLSLLHAVNHRHVRHAALPFSDASPQYDSTRSSGLSLSFHSWIPHIAHKLREHSAVPLGLLQNLSICERVLKC